MGFLVRLVLVAAGAIAALFVAEDAGNFSVVQGMIGIALVTAVVLGFALLRRGRPPSVMPPRDPPGPASDTTPR